MFLDVERRLWTVDEYHRLAEAGILHEDDRVELIEGELLTMSPVGLRHVACVNRINKLFGDLFGGRAIVSVQNPVKLGEYSEPQPDLLLLKYRDDFYADVAPAIEDVLVCVEVSDTTIAYDRRVKRRLYARAGISEYWLVNLVDNGVEVHRQPEGDEYRQLFRRYRQEQVTVAAFPEQEFLVGDLTG